MPEPVIRYVAPRHVVIDSQPTPVPFWDLEGEKIDNLVIVIGGGPSCDGLDLDLLRNIQLFTINSSCRKVFSIAKKKDVLYFSDNSWSERFLDLIEEWPGKVVTSNRNTKARLGDLVNRLDISALTEFMMLKPDWVQASSGHSAVCLAARLGAKKIVLIGFEAQAVEGKTHGHDDYVMQDLGPFEERFLPGWSNIAPRLREFGVEVINSTPDSKINSFSFLPLREAIKYG